MKTGVCWVDVLSALLTPLIALLAVWIAFRQYRVDSRALKLSLYEKRFAVYAALRRLISAAVTAATVTNAETQQFLVESKEAEFLFEPNISAYLTGVYRKANELHSLTAQLGGLPVGEKRTAVVNQERTVLDWFSEQPEEAAKLFSPYLEFRKAR